MPKVEIEILAGGTMPTKAHTADSCYDVVATRIEHKPTCIVYYLGIKVKIPRGWEGELKSRSSIRKYHLQQCNGIGTMDENYRGEWAISFNLSPPNFMYFKLHNLPDPADTDFKIYAVGDKVGQICFRKKDKYAVAQVSLVQSNTERGEDGHGSSGK